MCAHHYTIIVTLRDKFDERNKNFVRNCGKKLYWKAGSWKMTVQLMPTSSTEAPMLTPPLSTEASMLVLVSTHPLSRVLVSEACLKLEIKAQMDVR